jgi:hypothetical protein
MQDDERVQGRSELDSRIDAALRNYAEPPETTEPRIALAGIMDQAHAVRPARHNRWWMWGLAGAVACLIAVVAALWVNRVPRIAPLRVPRIARVPQAPPVVTVPSSPAQPAVAQVRAPAIRRATRNRRTAAGREAPPLPKLAVFPTPRPLTPQEQALAAFARHGPPDVQRAVLEDQKHWDDPIIVADLHNRSPQPGTQQDQ